MATIPELKSHFRKFDARHNHENLVYPESIKRASVLIPVFLRREEWHVLLTVRSMSLRKRPGSVVFPGGFLEETDVDGVHAALREAKEEVGLDSKDVDILAVLPSLIIEGDICLTPVVATIPHNFRPELNTAEVSKVFDLPLSRFLRDDVIVKKWVFEDNEIYSHTFNDVIEGQVLSTSGSESMLCMLVALVILQSTGSISLTPIDIVNKDTAFFGYTKFVKEVFEKKTLLAKF